MEELADMMEIIEALANIEGKNLDDVVDVVKQKKLRRETSKRKYLKKVEE